MKIELMMMICVLNTPSKYCFYFILGGDWGIGRSSDPIGR